jgi:hypothetical protein
MIVVCQSRPDDFKTDCGNVMLPTSDVRLGILEIVRANRPHKGDHRQTDCEYSATVHAHKQLNYTLITVISVIYSGANAARLLADNWWLYFAEDDGTHDRTGDATRHPKSPGWAIRQG